MPLLFALTMFVSATLLFLVQPMVGKMILPLLGGTPAVWNTCMAFYQVLLLAGYYYAHRATSDLQPIRQTRWHFFVLLLPIAAMTLGVIFSDNHSPIPISKALAPQGDSVPFFGTFAVLAVAIALPFFVVSTSAPLLQKWFAYTGHPSSKDPYFLYGASNFGSLLALVSYPAIVEPSLRIIDQAWIWAIGYCVLVGLIGICAYMVRSAQTNVPVITTSSRASHVQTLNDSPPTLLQKLWWMFLAFVPSSLMLGVTTFASTDIGSMPLLWIIPLALYLITFIIVFANVPKTFFTIMTLITPVMILLLLFITTVDRKPTFGMTLLLHLATFFCITTTCHGELARSRPSTKYLTSFYLLMSIGGMIGGIFNSLISPLVFTFITEYPLAIVCACFLIPKLDFGDNKPDTSWFNALDILFPLTIGGVTWFLLNLGTPLAKYGYLHFRESITTLAIFGIVIGIVCLAFQNNRFRTSLSLMMFSSAILYGISGGIMHIVETYKTTEDGQSTLSSELKLIVRLLFALVPVAAYVYYWLTTAEPISRREKYLYCGGGILITIVAFVLGSQLSGIGVTLSFRSIRPDLISERTFASILFFGLPAMLCYFFVERPIRFGLAVAAVMLTHHIHQTIRGDTVVAYDRSFFGTLKVELEESRFNLDTYKQTHQYPEDISFESYPDPTTGKELLRNPFYRRYSQTNQEGETVYAFREVHPLMRLAHGTTLHGIQRRDGMLRSIASNLGIFNTPSVFAAAGHLTHGGGEHWQFPGREPLTYYHRTGPVGKMFEAFREKTRTSNSVGCIGLGTGSLSAYGLPGQSMTFFEIDSHVKDMVYDSRDKATRDAERDAYLQQRPFDSDDDDEIVKIERKRKTYFTYVNDAEDQGVPIKFIMGDARISLENMPDTKFGLLLVDAFSSDSIPVHLLTKEAVKLFLEHIEEDGIIGLHISNRYLDLEPVVEKIARELKIEALAMSDNSEGHVGKTASTWIALAKNRNAFGRILLESKEINNAIPYLAGPGVADLLPTPWQRLEPNYEVGLWTDDYSPFWKILRSSFRLFGTDD